MKRLKKILGSIYARFVMAFVTAFFFSILITVLIISLTQLSTIQTLVDKTISNKAAQLRTLVTDERIPLEKAIRYVNSTDIRIDTYQSIEETGLELSADNLQRLKSKSYVVIRGNKKYLQSYGLLKLEDTYIKLSPDINDSPIAIFMNFVRFITIIPMILGMISIIFATLKVVKPIKRISKASKEIAEGNFDIELPVKGHDEVAELTTNFNLMIKELSANEYLHKDFVSNVSHEFKTPITSLKGYAKLLKDQSLSEEARREYADIIISETERLSRLSSNLLKLAELENEVIGAKREWFSLSEQIRDVLLLLQNQWEAKSLQLELETEEISYLGDKELMYQVWVNLISNAIKYSNKDGLLKISVQKGKNIEVCIADSGIGISAEDLDKVFQRFYKSDKARNSSGTGLGLPIARKIVELHGGSIRVKSQLGSGSAFIIELPEMEQSHE